ncbi:MAG: hypothetical protein JO235_26075 [Chroococcidiopsidaceae cyanobacterium CP_BM_RX_35]|nr:hypothetical protein [Chroococcidiopsidaceae cyanobacterium CP_BM_RX_35]
MHQSLPKNSSAINTQLTHVIGLSAIALGIFLLALITISYLNEVKSLEREDYLYRPSYAVNHLLGIGLAPDIQSGIAVAVIARNIGLAVAIATLNGQVKVVPIIIVR